MLELVPQRPPLPPADLMLRVGSGFAPEGIEDARTSFDHHGLDHLRAFERALAGLDRTWTDFERLLDFGCGCGRFLRHLVQLNDRVEIHGTDIDAEMVAWLRANVPGGYYEVAPHEPPVPYPDGHFDLVINHSVFTHLDVRHQDLWLAELRRITRPDAVLLLTVESTASWNFIYRKSEQAGVDVERWRQALEAEGVLFVSDDHWVGSSHPDFYHTAFHAPWYIFEHWTEFFDLAAYIPEGSWSQDLIVMRRRSDDDARQRPIGHGSSAIPALAEPHPSANRSVSRIQDAAQSAFSALAARVGRRLSGSLSSALGTSATPGPGARQNDRELKMLRAGLYEQGRRISVIAAELRDEIEALRRESR